MFNRKKTTEAEAAPDAAVTPPAAPDTANGPANAAVPELTAEQLQALQARAAKAEEHWDRLVRLTADFDNFRKRAARERQEAIKYANESLLEKLVPVVDHFEAALAAAATTETTTESFKTGVQLILGQLRTVMVESGLEEIDAAGQPFDPRWHEAISQQDSAEAPEGQVLQQVRKGYKLRDRLIRPASVIVSRKPVA